MESENAIEQVEPWGKLMFSRRPGPLKKQKHGIERLLVANCKPNAFVDLRKIDLVKYLDNARKILNIAVVYFKITARAEKILHCFSIPFKIP